MKKNNRIELYDIDKDFGKAINAIKRMYYVGGVFIYPTDTVYCVGANPLNLLAIDRLKKISKPDFFPEATLLIDSVSNLINYIDIASEKHFEFLISIWPNPVNVIFKLNKQFRNLFGMDQAIFKIPNNRFCLKLLTEIGNPLICIKLNNNHTTCKGYEILKEEYSELVDAIFYTNKESFNEDSALVDLTNYKPIIIKENKFKLKGFIDDYRYVS
ncbi:MAG: Sua5/YciO/YrdC/YwlC family protein [Bacteroidetes bacterium]|nr:Sua5/YciO/YrdC/YwlC family protein [Bacteroidota bacterium]